VLVAGIVLLVISVLTYVLGTSYVAGEYRKLGYDRRIPGATPLDANVVPEVPRVVGLAVLASYPGALIGVILIVLGIL
jgi:hypothetical protein